MRVLNMYEVCAVSGGEGDVADYVGTDAGGTKYYVADNVTITGSPGMGQGLSLGDGTILSTAVGISAGALSWYRGGTLAAASIDTALAIGTATGLITGAAAILIVAGAMYYAKENKVTFQGRRLWP